MERITCLNLLEGHRILFLTTWTYYEFVYVCGKKNR